MSKTLVLLGGGIDSTTLLSYLALTQGRCTAFWVDYGQVAAREELASCMYFCDKYEVPLEVADLRMRMGTSSILTQADKNVRTTNVLDGRNAVLLSMGACYAANYGFTEIAIGYHHEPDKVFPDAGVPFFAAYQALMQVGLVNKVNLIAPFRNLPRDDLFKFADTLDTDILDRAHTCYDNTPGGCGKCSHCNQKASYVRTVPDVEDRERIRAILHGVAPAASWS
jgi:7-cyano-7-deazaguanine synthase